MISATIQAQLYSSSRVHGGAYLQTAKADILSACMNGKRCTFVPFAAVDMSFADYGDKVSAALDGLPLANLASADNPNQLLVNTDVLIVGGGNTFCLLAQLQRMQLLPVIRQRVMEGMIYIGWSAGSNLFGPSIRTTNDMPIVQPENFDALGLLPLQINPHYVNQLSPEFHGETRDQRLTEFCIINPTHTVVAMPEGSRLLIKDGRVFFQTLTSEGYVLQLQQHNDRVSLQKHPLATGQDLNQFIEQR